MIVILDNIRSIHNVGSIFRTSDALNIEKIYLGGITPAPLDRFHMPDKKLAKVALGAELIVPWLKVEKIIEVIDNLKKEGYVVCALEQHTRAISIFNNFVKTLNYDKLVLIVGSEVDGIKEYILSKADYILDIPMEGAKESLNVSVAFGIAAYQLKYCT